MFFGLLLVGPHIFKDSVSQHKRINMSLVTAGVTDVTGGVTVAVSAEL